MINEHHCIEPHSALNEVNESMVAKKSVFVAVACMNWQIHFVKNTQTHHQTSEGALTISSLWHPLGTERGRFHLRWSLKRGLVLWASECINQKPKWRSNSYRSSRLIKHTKKLMDKEDKLCLKILKTLREMLEKKESFEQSVSTWHFRWL